MYSRNLNLLFVLYVYYRTANKKEQTIPSWCLGSFIPEKVVFNDDIFSLLFYGKENKNGAHKLERKKIIVSERIVTHKVPNQRCILLSTKNMKDETKSISDEEDVLMKQIPLYPIASMSKDSKEEKKCGPHDTDNLKLLHATLLGRNASQENQDVENEVTKLNYYRIYRPRYQDCLISH